MMNNHKAINSALIREWHPTFNDGLLPEDVTAFSHRMIWWLCKQGHEWQARIYNRSDGNGCPYCSGWAVSKDNCLETVNPILASEWHLTKNGSLTPTDVTAFSHKRVWWRCTKGHEWQAVISSRNNNGTGCPYCSGRVACEDNCLEKLRSDLIKEWHPIKNGKLTPKDVTAFSNKKVWWFCKKGHVWETTVCNRTSGKGCPYCSGQAVCEDNCLATIRPDIAMEWHPTLNGDLTPKDVTSGSGKRVWWRCNWDHEWQTTINHRNRGSGCPYCWDLLKKGILKKRLKKPRKIIYKLVDKCASVKFDMCFYV